MTDSIWKPHVTVAALVCRDDRFLLVEEETTEGRRFNQPAGHLEAGESLLQAVVREAREETGYDFHPNYLVGIYLWPHPEKDMTYLRFAFAGELRGYDPERGLDTGILGPRWLNLEELRASRELHRSPLILRCVEDALAGRRFPLDCMTCYA